MHDHRAKNEPVVDTDEPRCYVRPEVPMWWVCYWVTQAAMHLRFSVRVTCPVRLDSGPLVIAAKHGHYWDVPALGQAALHAAKERLSFEMARFDGYPILGLVQRLFLPMGGFPVMRPKDALRLKKREGLDASALREIMRRENATASKRRATILRGHAAFAYFPEGTRDTERVRELRSDQEVAEAIALANTENLPVRLMPVVLNYGPKKGAFSRRGLEIVCGEPMLLGGTDAQDAMNVIRDFFTSNWRAPNDPSWADPKTT